MATETDLNRSPAAFVHRLTRGHTRWFFQCSMPVQYLDWLIEADEAKKAPEDAGRKVAAVLDDYMRHMLDKP